MNDEIEEEILETKPEEIIEEVKPKKRTRSNQRTHGRIAQN